MTAEAEMTKEDMVREALRENVIDPEIGINVVDLGLVYEIGVEDGIAEITMTLTTPACPLGPYLDQEVRMAVQEVPGVEDIKVNLVWTPPWDPSMMTEEAKLELGFW
jgi:metal-sulfur cluster biosynthetic enzyme